MNSSLGDHGEFSSSSFGGLEKTMRLPARRKISCVLPGNGNTGFYPIPPASTMKMMVLSFCSCLATCLLTLNFAVLSALPEPPFLAPRRGVARRWRRERFLERCQMRRLRLMELVAT
eukprot:GFUD01068521.1.p1 GENE.GFUD01068521.1~~GFUD01068521.1.p1  ORF type:complete len:117 (-),score=35.51 GFUD01068521.1:48-398(-)